MHPTTNLTLPCLATLTTSTLLLLLLSWTSPLYAGEITLLTPPAKSTLHARHPVVHLVLRLENPADLNSLKLETESGEQPFTPSGSWENAGKLYVHYHLPLQSGRNRFTLAPTGDKIQVQYKPLRTMLGLNLNQPSIYLFHRDEKVPAECGQCHDERLAINIDNAGDRAFYGPFSPVCYSCHKEITEKSNWQHSPVVRLFCPSCHQPGPADNRIAFPAGRMDDLCYSCHSSQRAWKKMTHVHGPVGTGDCTVCHSPHGDRHQYQLWADGKGELCVACHTDKLRLLQETGANFYPHGILKGRGCTACHSPHATNHRYQLPMPINDLCTSCHIKQDSNLPGHPVAKHPVSGTLDPRRAGRELVCTSCHNPHGSAFPHILIGEIVGYQLCTKCHNNDNRLSGKIKPQ